MTGSHAKPASEACLIAFTICARNFLAQAQVLHDSLRFHHTDSVMFYVALCDEVGDLDVDSFPFPIIPI